MAGSRFGSHIKWWFFIVPLVAVFIMPAIPDPSSFQIPPVESQSVATLLGDVRADAAVEQTNRLFSRYFVNTGLIRRSMESTQDPALNDGGMSDLASTWVRNFWRIVYRVVYRLTVMKLWLMGTAVFCVAMFVDGAMRRKARAAAAGYASPLSFHVAGHGILLVLGVSFAVLVVPFPVLAPCWIAIAACLGTLLWKAASSYQ
jgi:hypothetical protein